MEQAEMKEESRERREPHDNEMCTGQHCSCKRWCQGWGKYRAARIIVAILLMLAIYFTGYLSGAVHGMGREYRHGNDQWGRHGGMMMRGGRVPEGNFYYETRLPQAGMMNGINRNQLRGGVQLESAPGQAASTSVVK